MGNDVAVNYLTMDVDVPRLLFKLYSKDNTKEEISSDAEIMKNYFGSEEIGTQVMKRLSDKEWFDLADSISTVDE